MRLLRFRLRTLMIAIAVIAPVFAAWAALQDLNRSLHAFYGPGGPIALQRQFYQELGAGSQALQHGDFDAAEKCYIAALKLAEKFERKEDQTGWFDVPGALIGLANALTGRGHFDEAEPLYLRALTIRQDAYGRDNPAVAEVLEHHAASCHTAGRTADRDQLQSQAKAIRAKQRRE